MTVPSLTLQPSGDKMPLLGFGTWKVPKDTTADVVYKVLSRLTSHARCDQLLGLYVSLITLDYLHRPYSCFPDNRGWIQVKKNVTRLSSLIMFGSSCNLFTFMNLVEIVLGT